MLEDYDISKDICDIVVCVFETGEDHMKNMDTILRGCERSLVQLNKFPAPV